MKVLNLFAGPGAGKSTTAARLFTYLKDRGINVELVTEYAKDLTWENREDILQDQLYVLAKQNRRLSRLKGKVDWVVTDSPILLGHHYATPDYFVGTFKPFLLDLWNSYENYNVILNRVKPYKKVGRTQSEEEAVAIDAKIRALLVELKLPHFFADGNEQGARKIQEALFPITAEDKV